jgi:hypothetical protein
MQDSDELPVKAFSWLGKNLKKNRRPWLKGGGLAAEGTK